MFTGLVLGTGTVSQREARGPGARLRVAAKLEGGPLVLGESVAVDGCCVSVIASSADGFEADISAETLARTTLGRLALGAPVNLERSLALGDRMGGHLVTGHVDGTGQLLERRPVGEAAELAFSLPLELARFVAKKGSIATNGVSLTVNAVGVDRFEVTLIPITMAITNLGRLGPGDPVNLEVDLVARYILRAQDLGEGVADGRFS